MDVAGKELCLPGQQELEREVQEHWHVREQVEVTEGEGR